MLEMNEKAKKDFTPEQLKQIEMFAFRMLTGDRIEDSLVLNGIEVRFTRASSATSFLRVETMKRTTKQTDFIIESQQKRGDENRRTGYSYSQEEDPYVLGSPYFGMPLIFS